MKSTLPGCSLNELKWLLRDAEFRVNARPHRAAHQFQSRRRGLWMNLGTYADLPALFSCEVVAHCLEEAAMTASHDDAGQLREVARMIFERAHDRKQLWPS